MRNSDEGTSATDRDPRTWRKGKRSKITNELKMIFSVFRNASDIKKTFSNNRGQWLLEPVMSVAMREPYGIRPKHSQQE